MNFKKAVLFFCFWTSVHQLPAQQITAYINKHKAGTVTITEDRPVDITIELKKYRQLKSLSLQLQGVTSSLFKRSLELMDQKDSLLLSIPETINHAGFFSIDVNKLKKFIFKTKEIHLYYTENPKNPMMKMRSKNSLLMNLHLVK